MIFCNSKEVLETVLRNETDMDDQAISQALAAIGARSTGIATVITTVPKRGNPRGICVIVGNGGGRYTYYPYLEYLGTHGDRWTGPQLPLKAVKNESS